MIVPELPEKGSGLGRSRIEIVSANRRIKFAAICAVARRHNDISPLPPRIGSSRCTDASPMATPGPLSRGFYAAIKLRMFDWAPLLDFSDINHGPTGVRCSDRQGKTARRPQNYPALKLRTSAPIPGKGNAGS
jgi:hypothetical protein